MKLSGRITRSTDECEMSRSCHSATFSIAAIALPRSSRARPTICSQPIGLRLCGIADEPFCPFANGSSTSPISVFCRPRISSANFSRRRGGDRERAHQLGVAIALDHLRRHGVGLETQPLADVGFDRRIEVRERADRAGDHADANRPRGRGARARCQRCEVGVPQRQLEAERHHLGVHAVRAADHRRVLVLDGARLDRLGERRPCS